MSPTPVTDKENKKSSLADSFSLAAKNFLLLPGIARDLNEAVQSIIGIVKQKGGEAKEGPDEKFIAEQDYKTAEKLKAPTAVTEEKAPKKKGILGTLMDNILNPKKMIQNMMKGFRKLLSPKNIMKVLGKIALPVLIVSTIWVAISSAFEKWKETGSIWEAYKEAVGSVVEFLTLGLIDKETIKNLYQGAADFLMPVIKPIQEFFGKFSDWVGEKFSAVLKLFGIDIKSKEAPKETPQKEQVATPDILKSKVTDKEKDAQQKAADLLSKPVTLPSEPPPPKPEVQPKVTPTAPTPTPVPATPPAAAPAPAAKAPTKAGKKEEGIPKPVQKISGMEDVKKMVIRHEGVRNEPYKDSLGLWTVGVGHLIGDGKSLPDSYKRKFSNEEVMNLFEEDFAHHVKIAEKTPSYDKANEGGKAAFIDLAFNMGKWWPKWPGTKAKLEDGDFAGAADGLENSKWYTQVGNRAKTIVALVEQADDGKGQKIAQASNSVSVGQRQQAKSQTPMIINTPTTNNTKVVNNQPATMTKDKANPTNMVLARVA